MHYIGVYGEGGCINQGGLLKKSQYCTGYSITAIKQEFHGEGQSKLPKILSTWFVHAIEKFFSLANQNYMWKISPPWLVLLWL